jgi:hypothetical protein
MKSDKLSPDSGQFEKTSDNNTWIRCGEVLIAEKALE